MRREISSDSEDSYISELSDSDHEERKVEIVYFKQYIFQPYRKKIRVICTLISLENQFYIAHIALKID